MAPCVKQHRFLDNPSVGFSANSATDSWASSLQDIDFRYGYEEFSSLGSFEKPYTASRALNGLTCAP